MTNFKGPKGLPGTCVFSLLFSAAVATVLAPPPSFAQDNSHSPGWVVIGIEEYKALHAKAYPPEREPEPPPVEATLSRVDYDLRVNAAATEFASGRANLTIDVLKDGWVRVPIPAGLLVREARLDGKLVSLVSASGGRSSGSLSAVLSRPGRSVLTLDVALPIATNAGEESIVLPPSVSGVTRAAVEIPKQGIDIRLSGGLLSSRSESASTSKWIVYATGNAPLTFTWRRKTEDHRAELPLRLRGNLTQLLGLGEDSATLTAEVSLEIAQGLARSVELEVPPQVTINQVSGATISDWESKDGRLTVSFLEPVDQSARFVISGEARLRRDGQMQIPLLKLLNVERLNGGAAVEVLGAGEIKDVKTEGLENADASDLGELVANRQSPSLAAFRFRAGDAAQPRALTLNIARYDQQAVLLANVEEARYRVLFSKDGKTLVEARYAVRNNQRNFLKIALPQNATLWSTSLAGQPIRPGQAPDGGILLPLEKSKASEDAPEFPVTITYLVPGTAWADKGKSRLPLPALDLPISRTGVQVFYPPLFRVSAEPSGPFRAEAYTDPTSPVLALNSNLMTLQSPGVGVAHGIGAGLAGGVAGGSFQAGVGVGATGGTPTLAPPAAPPPPSPSPLPIEGRSSTGLATLTAPGKYDDKDAAQAAATQTLLDKYRASTSGSHVAGILPIEVAFPAFGPSLYLVSELTAENQSPRAELDFQQDKKGGSR
jgi:hypothetical protein